MKGFIEVTSNLGHRVILNLSNVTDFVEASSTKEVFVGFITSKEDCVRIKESYDEVMHLIGQSQK